MRRKEFEMKDITVYGIYICLFIARYQILGYKEGELLVRRSFSIFSTINNTFLISMLREVSTVVEDKRIKLHF